MAGRILGLFIVIPIVEMWLLLQVGSVLGPIMTIGLVLLTAMLGLRLLRQQGLATLAQAQTHLNQGQLPAQEIASGLFLAVGGALLLTPGFITDAIGFACLLPWSRQLMLSRLLNRRSAFEPTSFGASAAQTRQQRPSQQPGVTLDGEYTREK